MSSPTTSPRPAYPPASLSAAAASSIDKSTLALIRRVLCSHAPPSQPLGDLLGPLTRSPEVDVQLYALVAIIWRDFVDSWYANITNDQELVREAVGVVGAVVAELEQRACKIDLEVLLLDELPAMLENHIKDYRLALSRTGTSITPHLTTTQIFHNLQPHPALSSSSSERLYNRLLSSGLLSVLLPPADLESDCESSLIREILANIVLGNTIDKLSEPWMLYEIITKLLLLISEPSPSKELTSNTRKSPTPNGTISEKSYPLPSSSPPPPPPPPHYAAIRIPPALDSLLTVTTRILGLLKTFLVSLLHTIHTPPAPPRRPKPLLRMSLFSLIPSFLRLPSLQPWLMGAILLLSRPFTSRSNRVGAVLDNLLCESVHAKLGSPEIVIAVLRLARNTVFPGNVPMGPARPTPEVCEKEKIRGEAEEALIGVIPESLRKVWFADEKMLSSWVAEGLDVFAVKEINKHLLYNVVDLVVGKLVPELVEAGPSEIKRSE